MHKIDDEEVVESGPGRPEKDLTSADGRMPHCP
jgi:hypothetical protein